MSEQLSVVGKRLPRPDVSDKATGQAKYTADLRPAGLLVGRVLRSPHAHARILHIDTSGARQIPGVEAVITAGDVPGTSFNINLLELALRTPHKAEFSDQHIFSNPVRFVGDSVAAVAAINEAVAEQAIKAIKITYEPLPAVFDPVQATKSDAPRIHDFAERNLAEHIVYPFAKGDMAKAFAESDAVVEGAFITSRQKHCQLEPTACTASLDFNGRLTVWSPCQLMHMGRRLLATIFNMDEGLIRWITPATGGGFGQRLSLTNEPIAAALALKTGKPVIVEDTREEDFVARESRQAFIEQARLGVKKDGTMLALQVKLIADAGAYYTHSGTTTQVNMRNFMGLYRCPNLACEADVIYTNTQIAGGMRGYGNPEAIFALEQLIDMAAEKIGMDPVEFRLRNIKKVGEPSQLPTIPIENTALKECIEVGAAKIEWKQKRAASRTGNKRRGVGLAINSCSSGAAPNYLEHSNAQIKFNADGSVNLIASPHEMGQGIMGVLAQIAAEELSLSPEDIHIVTGDTDVTQFDIGSHASRSTYVVGMAALRAAQVARKQLLDRASKALGVAAADLDLKDKRIFSRNDPSKVVSIAEIARAAIYNFQGESLNISGRCSYDPGASRSFHATFVEVEVDMETGDIRVIRAVMIPDSGRLINPMSVEGQEEGAAVQAMGFALTEDYVINDSNGALLTDNFNSYRVPTTLDVPEIEVVVVEHPVASGPFGARGAGETGMMGMAAAIANAVYDAAGVRIITLPITPEKVYEALKKKERNTTPPRRIGDVPRNVERMS